VENQAECLKFWKKNSKGSRGHLVNSVGGGVESQFSGGRGGKSGRVFEILEKKFKGSRGHLAKFSGGGVENQAECLKFWRKNSRAPADT
jgi:hypothetical protein